MKPVVVILGDVQGQIFKPYDELIEYVKKRKQEVEDSEDDTFKEEEEFDLVTKFKSKDVIEFLQDKESAILLFSIGDKESLSELVAVVKTFAPAIKKKLFRFTGANFLTQKKVKKFLENHNCQEMISPKINAKSLSFKVGLHCMTVTKAANNVLTLGQTLKNYMDNQEKVFKAEITHGQALSIPSDCWLIDSKCLSYGEKGWAITVAGPGQHAGDWIKLEDDNLNMWAWAPMNEHVFDFIKEHGVWYFVGDDILFNDELNRWVMKGNNVSLYFEESINSRHYRFRTDSCKCKFAKNSPQAIEKMELMSKSCDPDFEVPSEDAKKVDTSKEADNKKLEIVNEEPEPVTTVKSFEGRIETFGDVEIDFSSVDLLIKMHKADEKEVDVGISDLMDNLIVVKTAKKIFADNDEVMISVKCKYTNVEFDFKMEGSVIEQFERGDGSIITTVELSEFSQIDLDQLLEVFLTRQENIDEFLSISKAI